MARGTDDSRRGVAALFATSVAARLPLASLALALLVHAERLTGSFATAGVVTGAYAVAEGVGAPGLGRLVDRRGQTVVLLGSAGLSAGLLVLLAVLPERVPPAVLILLAAGIGLATPPLGACVRTVLPDVLRDPAAVRAAYAFEASAVEVTFVLGPPLALGVGALWSTGGALASAGVVLLLATGAFASRPASRRWRPGGAARPRGGSLRAPAMRTLVLILVAVGGVFGAVEVGVTAAADGLGTTAGAGPLLALWGLGSLVGGAVAARLGGGARTARGLLAVLLLLGGAHAALVLAPGSATAIGAVLLIAGGAIAPTYATIYAMVDEAAPAGTVTEAFAWLATASALGAAAGAATAGALVDAGGPAWAFMLAGGAGAAAVAVALLRARTLPGVAVPEPVPACP